MSKMLERDDKYEKVHLLELLVNTVFDGAVKKEENLLTLFLRVNLWNDSNLVDSKKSWLLCKSIVTPSYCLSIALTHTCIYYPYLTNSLLCPQRLT